MADRIIISSAIFGIGIDREGFKIKAKNGIFAKVKEENLQKYLQLPHGIDIAKDATILEVIRFWHDAQYYFILKKYTFSGFENSSGRPCYYASALLFQFRFYFPNEKEILDKLETVSKIAEKAFLFGENITNLVEFKLEPAQQTDKQYPQSEEAKKGVIKINDNTDLTIRRLILDSFKGYYSDYRRLFFTSSNEVISNSKKQIEKLNWSITEDEISKANDIILPVKNDNDSTSDKSDSQEIDVKKETETQKAKPLIHYEEAQVDDIKEVQQKISEHAQSETVGNQHRLTWIKRIFWACAILSALFTIDFIFSDSLVSQDNSKDKIKTIQNIEQDKLKLTITSLKLEIKDRDSIIKQLYLNIDTLAKEKNDLVSMVESLKQREHQNQLQKEKTQKRGEKQGDREEYRNDSIFHRVINGENLTVIGKAHNVTVEKLKEMNKLSSNDIAPNQWLVVAIRKVKIESK